jgi:GR25 family glycosyltransferase involved in LPS biosynthesis
MGKIKLDDMPIFCINLDRRPDRWLKFNKQPSLQKLPKVQRFSAVDGRKLSIEDNDIITLETKYNIINKTRRSHGEIASIGAIGCTMSHINVWKKFIDEYPDKDYCLILEDDAKLPSNLNILIENCSKNLPEIGDKFDVWLLYYYLYNKNIKKQTQNWFSPEEFWGTVAYIISREGVQKLLKDIYPIESQIDRYLFLKSKVDDLKIVIHKKLKVKHFGDSSDIQGDNCKLCNLPNDMKNLTVMNKYILTFLIGYSLIMTYMYIKKKSK